MKDLNGYEIFPKANLYNAESERKNERMTNAALEKSTIIPTVSNDSVFCEIIRRKALTIVDHNKILSKEVVAVEDAVNLVLTFFQTGNLDLYSDPDEFQDHFCFRVDEVTKKVELLFLKNGSQTHATPLQLPIDTISSLDELKDLKLFNINVTSSNAVQEKRAVNVSHKSQRSLNNLKKLDISYSKIDDEGVVLETQIFHLTPKLESITFRLFTSKTETRYVQNVLSDIRSSFCACRKTLRSVDLSSSMCTEDELKTLLVDVVPRLPNLVSIDMSANKIESIQRVTEGIKKTRCTANDQLQCQTSLQILDLSWNNFMLKIKDNPKEKAALMTILRTFKGLYNLGNNVNMAEYPQDMRYQLQINHAGRRMVEACCADHKTIPTRLIPFVFERAFEKSREIYPYYWRDEKKKDPTGIYYLIRSSPIVHALLRHRHRLAENDSIKPERRNDGYGEPRKPKRRKIILFELK